MKIVYFLNKKKAVINKAHTLKCYTCDDPITCKNMMDHLKSTSNQTCPIEQDFCYVKIIYFNFILNPFR